jgi:Ala-tRNA(Pro) deacylase
MGQFTQCAAAKLRQKTQLVEPGAFSSVEEQLLIVSLTRRNAMTTLQRCIDFLDRNRVPYTHSTHANAYRALEVAYAEHLPPFNFAKTVIFCGDDCYAMAVLPADCTVDLKELATNLGLAHIRLATEVELTRLFPECEVGAMPPLGTLFNLPAYLDERLADERFIAFNAGTHRDTIHMSFADYLCLAEAQVTRFAHPELNYLVVCGN